MGGLLALGASTLFACDAGSRADEDRSPGARPLVHVVDVNVGPEKPLPADGAIQVAFDRYLLPSTVTRQAVTVETADRKSLPSERLPVVTYDPVARTATLVPQRGAWLDPGVPFRLVLSIPEGDDDASGVRAVDRATLDPAQPLVFEFLVTAPTGAPYDEGRVSFCADVLPIFAAKCSGAQCHTSGADASASLELTTPDGVWRTAVGRVARGASTGSRPTVPESEGRAFGVNMPIVAPGSPGASWLIAKVELAPLGDATAPAAACAPPAGQASVAPARAWVPLTAARVEPGLAERDALGAFVQGAPMPYPVVEGGQPRTHGLDLREREILRRWIAQLVPGEPLPACGACP